MGLRWAMFDGTAGPRQFRRNHKPPVLAQAADSHAPGGLKFKRPAVPRPCPSPTRTPRPGAPSQLPLRLGLSERQAARPRSPNPPLGCAQGHSGSGWRLTLTSLVAY